MKGILTLLLAVQCSACAIRGHEQPPSLFVNPVTRDIIVCGAAGRRAGDPAEVNCVLKAQQSAGYISLSDLESSLSKPIAPPPSPSLDNQIKTKQPGNLSEVEKSRTDAIEKMRATLDGAEKLLALRIEEVKGLATDYLQRREGYDREQISRSQLEQAERDLVAGVERVEQDKRWVVETENALKEMNTRDELLRSPK